MSTPIEALARGEKVAFVQLNKDSHQRIRNPIGYVIRASGCWEWKGHVNRDGYGIISTVVNGRVAKIRAHRSMYEKLVGAIPVGLVIDHLCKNRRCVNPAHLEPVTHGENARRSPTASTLNAAKTHCVHGHPFDEANTYRSTMGRHCRTCRSAAMRRYNDKLLTARGARK